MKRLSEHTETMVRGGALHLIPAGIGAVLLLWLPRAGSGWGEWLWVPAMFLFGQGLYLYGLANGVDMARGNLADAHDDAKDHRPAPTCAPGESKESV